MSTLCPKCQSAETRYRAKRNEWICDDCDHRWTPEGERPRQPLRIFLSYGHDEHTATALRIKADLEARGHKVWFDIERLREGRDWEQYIEEGLAFCDKVVLLMTPYSVRRRNRGDPESRDGYCLNEIAKAMEKNKLIVPVLLVSLDDGPPASICRIQYLDLRDSVPIAEHEERYQVRLERLAKAVEEDDLDFEGGQARLRRLLQPISFEADMSRHIASFTGRVWLLAELDEWLEGNSGSRVFWLMGGPGIGKTAVATHLSHFRSEVIGYHFCTHGHADKGDPARAVLSIAYQMAQHLPEYGRRLGEKDLERDVAKNAGTLFDNLIVEPLGRDFPAPDGSRLVVIDALDEATSGGRNAIAELIRDHWAKTPSWLRLVITSRPELEVVSTLGHLAPYTLDAQRAENLADLERFLEREIAARGLPVTPGLIRTILDKSEGVFLYARVLFDEIDAKHLTLDRPEELPAGLYGHYHRFFSRQLPDVDRFRGELRPLLEIVCAGRAPVPVALLARALGVSGFDVRERLMRLGSLLNVRRSDGEGGDGDAVAPFHKSVRDWLTAIDERTRLPVAGPYVIDGERGGKCLADAVAAELKADVAKASAYALRYGPGHLVEVGRAAEAAELMTEFGYHYARLERLGRGEVVAVSNDFSQLDGLAGIETTLQPTLRSWDEFYSINSHLVRREIPALGPETSLFQCAIADGDASVVTANAERWLESVGSDVHWFRALRRPRDPRRGCMRTLEGHKEDIQTVALAADRRRALSGCSDGSVKVWDLDSGQCLHTLEGLGGPVEAVAFLSGDRLAISTCYCTTKIWDLDTGRCVRTLAGSSGGISPLPGGTFRFLLGCRRGGFELWDVDAPDSLRLFSDYFCARDIAVSGDGRRAATTTGHETIDIWEVGTGERTRTLKGHTHYVTASAISSDGTRVLSASRDRTLKLWDADTGQCVRTLLGHLDDVNAVALSSDGRCAVSASSDKTIRVWDVGTGRCARVLDGHGDWVNDVVLSHDGRYALSGAGSPGGKDCTVRLWNLQATPSTDAPERHNGIVQAVAVSSVSRLVVSGSWDKTMKVWDVETGACRGTLRGHTDHVCEIMLLPDGRRAISQCLDRKTRVWDLESGCCVQELTGHSLPVNQVAIVPDGTRAVSASNDNTLKVWNLHTGRCLQTLTGHMSFVNCVAIAKRGDRAASGSGNARAGVGNSDTTVRVWDLDTGQCLHVFAGNSSEVTAVAFSVDGRRVISGGADPTVRVWDLDTGLCSHTLEGHPGVSRVALSSDGRCAFSIDRHGVLKIWTLETGRCERTLRIGVPGRVADGCVLTKLDNAIALWDLEAGSCLGTWQPEQQVWGYDFDDDLVAVGTAAGDVLWAKLEPPERLRPASTVVVWHPSRLIVAVVRTNGTILLQSWHPESQYLEELARTEKSGARIERIHWTKDGARLVAVLSDGAMRAFGAMTLTETAGAPMCELAEPSDVSPDGKWRAVIRSGQLEVEPASFRV